MRNKNKKTIPILEKFEDRIVPSGTPILFDFEDQNPKTYDAPISLTKNNLTIEISRNAVAGSGPDSVFKIENPINGTLPSMGKRVLSPNYPFGDVAPFLINFSKSISSVSLEMGDKGQDYPDTLKVDLYSLPGGKGTLVGSKSVVLPHKGDSVFTSAIVTATANSAMSAIVIGGTPEYPNSTFLDNLKVTPVEAPPALGSISGRVSLDQNGGKSIGSSDPGVPSVTVFVDTNNNGFRDTGEIYTQSNQDGNYILSSISAGTINLRVVDPEGRKILLPSAGKHEFKLAPGEIRTGVNLSLKGETILKVVSTTPAPGTTDTKGVSTIQVQFNSDIDP